ncbi:MAG: 50S ribosomal protein L4 [Bacteroidetes bacterium]|nr:MAG: 50S ribosomal protein L4 [Bacteroidota bacterium]RLD81025.1 MAG: 50S ribosomal protein L4 [Bacteroidota bacterium]
MELVIYKSNGEKSTRKVKLDKAIFEIEPNDHAIWLDTRQIMANRRQGTHSSKERNAIKGSRRKLRRQKGSGAARVGDIKNPIFRGGGRVFGPHPRDYGFKLNKKVKKLARRSALTYKIKDKEVLIVEDFSFNEPKTKNFLELLGHFDLTDQRTLLVLPETDENILLSARNIQTAKVINANNLNTYDILHANKLLIAESSIKEIEKILA